MTEYQPFVLFLLILAALVAICIWLVNNWPA